MQTETEIQKLIDLLKDPSWVVRSNAADALGDLGAKEAIPYLIPLLNDPDNYICISVKQALDELG